MTRAALTPLTLLLTLLLPSGPGQATTTEEDTATAVPVSPGDWQAGVPVADTCPSFSWGAVAGAQRYELAIFDAQWDASPAYEEQQRQGVQLRQIAITAPALSWTPAGSDCLEEGGTYLWFVRAQTAEGEGPWSAPRFFEIDYDSDALTLTVRRELAAQLRQPEVWREVIQAALTTNGSLRLTPLASRAVATAGAAVGTGGAARPASMGLDNTPDTLASTAATFNAMALRISSAKGVVFDDPTATGGSPPGTGGIPASNDGTRFMWYPGKAALRAGYVNGVQWNDDFIGDYSLATGYNTAASGANATAMGYVTTASGGKSTAMGSGTKAVGDYATAMGWNTTASGGNATALGFSTTASGDGSTALGRGTTASGSHAMALGYETTASGPTSLAMGFKTTASAFASTAMGESTNASGDYSTAMGWVTTASGDFSTAMGYETAAQSYAETAIGRWNTLPRPFDPAGWVLTDRLFVIGNGTADDARSNALVVHKNGNLTISGQAYKPGGGSWETSSDARLKDIVGEYRSGLDEIAALQPVRYHYAVGNARGHDPAPEYVGLIAQQAQAVFPDAVSEGADGYLDFNMHAINVAMVNAIQTLNEQNQVQQELILDLRSENATLVQRLARQEQRHAAREQRLASLEAENARLTRLQADLTQIQEQLKVLQGQLAASASHGQIALGR